jgi:oligogalacturonide transport system substrate-binding protein
MMKSHSVFCLASAILLLLTGLASAGGKQEAARPESVKPEVAKVVEPVTMRFSWWGGDSRHKATLEAFAEYSKKYPNVKLEGEYSGSTGPYLTKLLTQLAGNTAPDIIQIDYKWVKDFTEQKDRFVNYNDVISKFDTSQIDMKLAEQYCSNKGFLLGLPIGLNAFALMYNPALFDKYGIKPIKEPTWDDIVEMGTKLHQADAKKYLLIPQVGHYYYMFKTMMLQRNGKNLMSDENYSIQFPREDAVYFFAYIKKLFDTGTIPPVEETLIYGTSFVDQIPSWHQQNYAMATTGASVLAAMVTATKFPVEMARFPVMKNPVNPGVFTPVSMMFGINAKSKYRDQAIDFINWYINDDKAIMIMKDARGVPVNARARKMLQDAKLILPEVTTCIELAASASGKPESTLDTNNELLTVFDKYWQSIGYKKITPEQAADAYMADLQKALDEMKAKAKK